MFPLATTVRTRLVFLSLVMVLAAVASGHLWAQDVGIPEAKAALEQFSPFKKHKSKHVRMVAVESLSETNHLLVTEELLAMLKDKAEMVQRAAEKGLERQTTKAGIARMIKVMWRGRLKAQRLVVMRVFRKLKPPFAYTAVQDLARVADPQLRAAAAELVGYYPDDGGKGLGTILPMLADKEPMVRLAAASAAAALGNPEGNTRILTLLADKDWRIRAAAMKALQMFRQKQSIQPMIDYIRSNKGRLVDDAKRTLTSITGFDYPADADRWQKWWDRAKDGFRVATKEELARQKKKSETSGYAKPRTHHPPYHGIKTRSRRMLFVVDISTSMVNNVVLEDSRPQLVKEFHERYGDSRNKIEITRNELIKIVAGLKPFVRFNIITFNSKVYLWSKGLVPANTGNRFKAIKFLDKLTPAKLEVAGRGLKGSGGNAGQTNTCAALRACYQVAKADDQLKKRYKTEADTVFFLSDGSPTFGDIVEPQPLLDHVVELNRKAGLVIHTIGFGSGNQDIMRTIAEITGGQYVCIGR